MKTYTIIPGERASKFFIDSLPKNGLRGPEAYCGCGRTHYSVDDAYAYQEGEDCNDRYVTCITEKSAEQLLADNPNGIVLNRETDCFEMACINNIDFIIVCPCNMLRHYENFIWSNKNEIRKYLKARIDQEVIWAQEQLTINKLMGI